MATAEMTIKSDIDYEALQKAANSIRELEETTKGLGFLTIDEIMEKKILPWSEKTLQNLFNQPDFPSCDYGKEKVVEVYAFRNYFQTKRERKNLVK